MDYDGLGEIFQGFVSWISIFQTRESYSLSDYEISDGHHLESWNTIVRHRLNCQPWSTCVWVVHVAVVDSGELVFDFDANA